MSSETKVISVIVVLTLLIIAGGLIFISGQNQTAAPQLTIKPDLLVRPDSPVLAGKDSKVQIVEFADFECPSCAALHPALKQLIAEEGDKITLVYRNFPIHGGSVQAATAVLAAGAQGKFWQMHDMVFEKQDDWAALPDSDIAGRDALFEQYATAVGVNIPEYEQAIKDPKYPTLISRDQTDGETMGINSTPTLIIDGTEVIRGAVSYATLKAAVDAEIAKNEASGTSSAAVTDTAATSATSSLSTVTEINEGSSSVMSR